MTNCTLTKLSNNKNDLRDNSIEGKSIGRPEIGKPFIMTAPPRDSGDVRIINTSIITNIISDKESKVIFKTINSTYQVKYR